MDPLATQAAIAAWAGVAVVLVGAVAAVAVQVLRNARDIQAAWRLLREHDAAITSGKAKE